MAVVVAIVVVVLILLAIGGGYYFYKQWRLRKSQRQLLSWAGDTMNYSLVDEADGNSSVVSTGSRPARDRSATGVSVSDIPFATYTNAHHGFRVLYPKEWSCHPSSANESVVVQFMCPQSERTYKRFSITWDDISWSNLTPASFANKMITNLPSAVPGSRLVSHRPLPSSSSHEVIYSVKDPVDSMQLLKLNVITFNASRAFTLVFAVDEVAYASTESLARHLIQSFAVLPRGGAVDGPDAAGGAVLAAGGAGAGAGAAGSGGVPETPTKARDMPWHTVTSHPFGLHFKVPSTWTAVPHRAASGAPGGTVEEQHYKSLKVFAANLSTVRAAKDKLLNDLLAHYKREVGKQPNGTVLEELRIKSALSGSCVLLRVSGRRALFDTTCATLVGLYTPTNAAANAVFGYIVSFTTSAEVAKSYEPIARYVFQSLTAGAM